jgi:hypothetical protein
VKTFFVTYAQNATPVHQFFWAAVKQFERHRTAEVSVIPGRYRNPTSRWSKSQKDAEWWSEELTPHLLGKLVKLRKPLKKNGSLVQMKPGRKKLCEGLTVFGDISVQPTAERPLSSFEVFTGGASAIFGHPKRALEVAPTSTRSPRVMFTTTACTIPNYTDSKAGKKGAAHHVLGGLVVEVDRDGTWFARHVTADWRTGEFTDLDTIYGPDGVRKAPRAETLTLGDFHSGREDEAVLAATERLTKLVKPKALVLHDFLDFYTRNHHESKRLKSLFVNAELKVEDELVHATKNVRRLSRWGDHDIIFVKSNHDEHLERWLDDHDDYQDPINAPYFHQLWARAFEYHQEHGKFPDLFALEVQRILRRYDSANAEAVLRRCNWLRINDNYKVAGVDHGFHGHLGINGSRGTVRTYARLACKVTVGHHHVPCICDGVFGVGITARLDHGYNKLPNAWMHAHCVLHADGKRQMIIIVNGRFRGGDK